MPVISAMGNLPIVKDLVVDMEPFWAKFRAVNPYLQPGLRPSRRRQRAPHLAGADERHPQGVALHQLRRCVSECNAMESDPDFLGPQALAKAMRFVGDPRDGTKLERLEDVNGEHGIWECTRCYFCNERCPKGVDPRDAIAKLGAESIKEGIDRDMGAKHAKWFVRSAKTTGWLRETELVPKTQGIVEAIKQTRFALELARHGKVPPPFPPHVAKDVKESRAPHDLVQEQGRGGYAGIVQGEKALAQLAHGARDGERDPYGEGSFPRPACSRRREEASRAARTEGHEARRLLQGLPRVALGEGARLVDAGARAEGRPRARSSSSRSPAAAPATSTRPSPTTTCT